MTHSHTGSRLHGGWYLLLNLRYSDSQMLIFPTGVTGDANQVTVTAPATFHGLGATHAHVRTWTPPSSCPQNPTV